MRALKVSIGMGSLLADKFSGNELKVSQVPGPPSARTIAGVDQLLVVLPQKIPAALWKKLPQGTRLQTLAKRQKRGSVPLLTSRVNNGRQTAIHLASAPANAETFEILTLARRLTAAALTEKPGTVGIQVLGFDGEPGRVIAESMVAAALAAAFPLASFKSEAAPPPLRSVKLLGLPERIPLERVHAEARGNNLARERVWPFPIGKEFLADLASDTADIKQCSPNGGGDHILAASFLNEFVDPAVPWVHVDLSSLNRKGGLAHVPTQITGFGVRYTMNLVLDQKLAGPGSGGATSRG